MFLSFSRDWDSSSNYLIWNILSIIIDKNIEYMSLATDGVSRSLKVLRKGTTDGERSLSFRLDVTREGRQRRLTLFYQSRDTPGNWYVCSTKLTSVIIDAISWSSCYAGSNISLKEGTYFVSSQLHKFLACWKKNLDVQFLILLIRNKIFSFLIF